MYMYGDFLNNYLTIIIFFGVALLLSIGFIFLNFVFAPKNPDPEKLSAYECGFEPFNDSRMEFDVRFYFCLLYTSPSPRDGQISRMPSSA